MKSMNHRKYRLCKNTNMDYEFCRRIGYSTLDMCKIKDKWESVDPRLDIIANVRLQLLVAYSQIVSLNLIKIAESSCLT